MGDEKPKAPTELDLLRTLARTVETYIESEDQDRIEEFDEMQQALKVWKAWKALKKE